MNTNEIRAKVNKLHARITKLAEGGNANMMDFNRYIDELVNNGELDLFKTCMLTRFDLNTEPYSSISSLKSNTWPLILRRTNAPLVERIRTLYKSKKVYQQGTEIRSNSTSTMALELSNTLSSTYSVVATSSKISLEAGTDDMLKINILDPKIRKINIYRVNWGTQSATPVNQIRNTYAQRFTNRPIQTIDAGTYYDTLSFTGPTGSKLINYLVPCTNSVYVSTPSIEGLNRIDVGLDITHGYLGDLEINLKAPNGNVINMFRPGTPGGFNRNFKNVKFTTSEEYPKLAYIYESNVGGTWQMNKFSGIGSYSYTSNANSVSALAPSGAVLGNWELYIRDTAPSDNGSLNAWNLTLGALKKNLYLTQSSYNTQIPMTHGNVYRIEVETFNPYGNYNYRLAIAKNDLLGTIKEVEVDNYLDIDHFVIKPELRKILGIKRTFLETKKASTGETKSMLGIDPSISEDSNLYLRYVQAIEYLIS